MTHAKAVLVRASLPADNPVLLGAVLQAIGSNMPVEVEGKSSAKGA